MRAKKKNNGDSMAQVHVGINKNACDDDEQINSKNDNKRTNENNKRDTYTSRKPQPKQSKQTNRKLEKPINGNMNNDRFEPRELSQHFDFNYAHIKIETYRVCIM